MDLHDRPIVQSRWFRQVVWILIAMAMVYAVIEHRDHLAAALPYLIFLMCPLMHMFHGHGHQHREASSQQGSDSTKGKGHTHSS